MMLAIGACIVCGVLGYKGFPMKTAAIVCLVAMLIGLLARAAVVSQRSALGLDSVSFGRYALQASVTTIVLPLLVFFTLRFVRTKLAKSI